MLLAIATYRSGATSSLAQGGAAAPGAAHTEGLVEEGAKGKDGNAFASPYSTPGIGVFTGHRHGLKGGRLTFGKGTYRNIFDPNPDSDLCGPGHWVNEARQCVECSPGKWCPGTSVVNECPNDSTSLPGSDALSDCTCAAGTSGVAGSCKTCPAGHYCPGDGADSKGKTLPQPCPPHSNSEAGKAVCRCNAAYYGVDFAACSACPKDHYCPGGREPFKCGVHQAAKPGRAICSAAPGFFGRDGEVPEVCPKNNYCPGGNVVQSCGVGSVSPVQSASADACVCYKGYAGPSGSDCTKCAAGSYCEGGSKVVKCPALTSSDRGSDDVNDCTCKPGFVGSDPAHCNQCPEGRFCPGGVAMSKCPGHSTSLKGATRSADCYCQVGYVGTDPNTCQPCPRGQYCLGGQAVNQCPALTSSSLGSWKVNQCLCVAGYYQETVDGTPSCKQCPANTFCTGGTAKTRCMDHSTAPAGSPAMSSCKCNKGFYMWNGACLACPAGKYCPGGADDTPRVCPASSSSPPGSDDKSDCVCNAGTYQIGGGPTMQCETCPRDSFCTGGAGLPSSA